MHDPSHHSQCFLTHDPSCGTFLPVHYMQVEIQTVIPVYEEPHMAEFMNDYQ